MINSRTKGASAEREVFKIISDQLGIKVERNLVQTREGGSDTVVGEWAIEVKRQETLSINVWWEQAVEQALRVNKKPMLIYRKSRMPWKVVVYARDLVGFYGGTVISEELAEIGLQMGIQILKGNHESAA
jgi:hypothetical protein